MPYDSDNMRDFIQLPFCLHSGDQDEVFHVPQTQAYCRGEYGEYRTMNGRKLIA